MTSPDVKPDAKLAPKDEWTLKLGCQTGERYALCHHLVELIEVVRHEPTYDVWKVKVLGPITMNADGTPRNGIVPPLKWGAELYDTEGAFTEQRAPDGHR